MNVERSAFPLVWYFKNKIVESKLGRPDPDTAG